MLKVKCRVSLPSATAARIWRNVISVRIITRAIINLPHTQTRIDASEFGRTHIQGNNLSPLLGGGGCASPRGVEPGAYFMRNQSLIEYLYLLGVFVCPCIPSNRKFKAHLSVVDCTHAFLLPSNGWSMPSADFCFLFAKGRARTDSHQLPEKREGKARCCVLQLALQGTMEWHAHKLWNSQRLADSYSWNT